MGGLITKFCGSAQNEASLSDVWYGAGRLANHSGGDRQKLYLGGDPHVPVYDIPDDFAREYAYCLQLDLNDEEFENAMKKRAGARIPLSRLIEGNVKGMDPTSKENWERLFSLENVMWKVPIGEKDGGKWMIGNLRTEAYFEATPDVQDILNDMEQQHLATDAIRKAERQRLKSMGLRRRPDNLFSFNQAYCSQIELDYQKSRANDGQSMSSSGYSIVPLATQFKRCPTKEEEKESWEDYLRGEREAREALRRDNPEVRALYQRILRKHGPNSTRRQGTDSSKTRRRLAQNGQRLKKLELERLKAASTA